jgi:hypothetical protein
MVEVAQAVVRAAVAWTRGACHFFARVLETGVALVPQDRSRKGAVGACFLHARFLHARFSGRPLRRVHRRHRWHGLHR